MNSAPLDSTINVRLTTQVHKRLRELAKAEDLKIADLVRKAIRKTYGPSSLSKN